MLYGTYEARRALEDPNPNPDYQSMPGKFFGPFRLEVTPGARVGDPTDMAGRILVVDNGNSRIQVFTTTFEFLSTFGESLGLSDDLGQFEYPSDVTIDSSGRIAIADPQNNRVQILTPAPLPAEPGYTVRVSTGGTYYTKDGAPAFLKVINGPSYRMDGFGSEPPSNGPGILENPFGVSFDEAGRLLVPDLRQHVVVFDVDGNVVTTIGRSYLDYGEAAGVFKFPLEAVSTGPGSMVVLDTSFHRVQVFAPPQLVVTVTASPATLVLSANPDENLITVRVIIDNRSNSPITDITPPAFVDHREVRLMSGPIEEAPGHTSSRFVHRKCRPRSDSSAPPPRATNSAS